MNKAVVTDTMALVLRLEHRRLPQNVRAIFAEAEQGQRHLFISLAYSYNVGVDLLY